MLPVRRLYQDDIAKGVPAEAVDKIRKMLAFLDSIEDERELRSIPAWKAHVLSGERKATWSLHVTRNWRLTFRIDVAEREIYDLDYVDYH